MSLSSRGHLRSAVIFEDINFASRPYDPWLAYGQSKTANVLFAVEATRQLFRLDNPYWDQDPAVFARGYVGSVAAWGEPLLLRAFALEGEDRARGLLADFLAELEERVAEAPGRYRGDYIEALVICRKAEGTGFSRGREP